MLNNKGIRGILKKEMLLFCLECFFGCFVSCQAIPITSLSNGSCKCGASQTLWDSRRTAMPPQVLQKTIRLSGVLGRMRGWFHVLNSAGFFLFFVWVGEQLYEHKGIDGC